MHVFLLLATLAIPDGRITGIVRDAKSGAPVAAAFVVLETQSEEREEHANATTGSDGRFHFPAVNYGRQTIRIFPPHHLEPQPAVFELGPSARSRDLDVSLDPGRALAVAVIDGDHPVANARVLAVTESTLRARTTTGEDGRATIAVPPGEATTLFVVSKDGPFGMLRVSRDHGTERLKVYMPRTRSSLLIRASRTDGASMPPFSLLMRYNGELVPPEVGEELLAVQGLELTSGDDGQAHLTGIPSGSYEFWPYRGNGEAQSIAASASALLAPIQVNVRSGENEIAVKFAVRGK